MWNAHIRVYGVGMEAHTARVRRGALTVALIALLLPMSVSAANAAPPEIPAVAKYIALGDSIAAGVGAGDYKANDGCFRTTAGYPELLDDTPRISLVKNVACSGATVIGVTTDQVKALNRGTTLVTITAGANGLNLPVLLAACAAGVDREPCLAAISAATTYRTQVLPGELATLIGTVAQESPIARILVTGYPIPFSPGLDPIWDAANLHATMLNLTIATAVSAAAANGAPVSFVPVDFTGHTIGSGNVLWINSNFGDASSFLHPTAAGYVAYRDAILSAIAP